MPELLQLGADGKPHSVEEATAHLGEVFGLTFEPADALYHAGDQPLHRAYSELILAGLLSLTGPKMNLYRISNLGRRVLEAPDVRAAILEKLDPSARRRLQEAVLSLR